MQLTAWAACNASHFQECHQRRISVYLLLLNIPEENAGHLYFLNITTLYPFIYEASK